LSLPRSSGARTVDDDIVEVVQWLGGIQLAVCLAAADKCLLLEECGSSASTASIDVSSA